VHRQRTEVVEDLQREAEMLLAETVAEHRPAPPRFGDQCHFSARLTRGTDHVIRRSKVDREHAQC